MLKRKQSGILPHPQNSCQWDSRKLQADLLIALYVVCVLFTSVRGTPSPKATPLGKPGAGLGMLKKRRSH